MKDTFVLLRKYYQSFVVLWAILVGLGLYFGHRHTAALWILSVAALLACIPPLRAQWMELRSGRYGLNVLPPVAVVTAVIIEQYWTAVVLALVITGTKLLQEYAARRTTAKLNELQTGAPQIAHVLRGRKTVDTAVTAVQKNYKLIIEPGEIVPVDAVILDGTSNFDESLLTGDNLPQKKSVNDLVMSGSINLDEPIKVKALDMAAHSTYEKAVKMLRSASTGAAHVPMGRRGETYTIPFTLVALGIAIAAWAAYGHASRFLDVLVVGTTVPLLSATALTFIAGVNSAARFGIFIKSARALEQLARTRSLVFVHKDNPSYPTKSSLSKLKKLGIANIVSITTNDKVAARKTLERLGATDVRAAQSAGEKLQIVEKVTARPVAFVGSEADDTLLLAVADVGIAFGDRSAGGNQADVVILKDDAQLVTTNVAIAKHTLRIARQGTWAGTGLSLALMVLFFFGFVPSLAGAIIQGVINLLVTTSALRAHKVSAL